MKIMSYVKKKNVLHPFLVRRKNWRTFLQSREN